jgi:uncharacterized protein (TIGR02466 family)
MTRRLHPEIVQAFGVPIIAFDIPDHEGIDAELRETILERRSRDKGLVRSNVNGWHSGEDFVDWGGRGAQFLAQTFSGICSGITEFPPRTDARPLRWMIRMWANVSELGAFNSLHHHPGAYWSGVYYVSDGRSTSGEDVGANLVLHSPHGAVSSMYAPDVCIKLPEGHRLTSTLTVRPRPGLGVIFPSWLMHEVEPYRGNGVRISIALNFSLAPRSP